MQAVWLALVLAAALPSPQAEQTLILPPDVAETLLVHREAVAAPPEAIRNRIHGFVRIAIHVGPDGRVRQAYPVSGHPLLAPAVRRAVLKYRFSPLRFHGRPTGWRSTLTIRVPDPLRALPARAA